MKQPRTIEILVAPDGQTRVQTHGFQGAACREASRFLEAALGQALSEQLTPEFHQSETASEQQTETD